MKVSKEEICSDLTEAFDAAPVDLTTDSSTLSKGYPIESWSTATSSIQGRSSFVGLTISSTPLSASLFPD